MKKLLLIFFLLLLGAGTFAYWYVQQNPEVLLTAFRDYERGKAGLEQREILVDGEPWPYLEGGPQDGEIIVLLHGFGGDKDHWTRLAANLTDRYRVIAPDLPGFGESPRHQDWVYDMPSQLPRLNAFLKEMGLELTRIHVAGNSMGGNLAAYFAANYSHRVISLAILNGSGVASPRPSEMDLARERGENPLLVENAEDFDRMLDFLFVEPPAVPDIVKEYMAQRAVANRDFNAMIYTQYGPNRRGWLEQYLFSVEHLPVLLLWGDQDRVTHVSTIETMTPILNNETVVIMPDTGHLPMLERPAETAAHFREFIEAAKYSMPAGEEPPAAADPSDPLGT